MAINFATNPYQTQGNVGAMSAVGSTSMTSPFSNLPGNQGSGVGIAMPSYNPPGSVSGSQNGPFTMGNTPPIPGTLGGSGVSMFGGQGSQGNKPFSITDDWKKWFDVGAEGSQDKWGGSLTKTGDTASWMGAGGNAVNMSANATPQEMYQAALQIPGMAEKWKERYGLQAMNDLLNGSDPGGVPDPALNPGGTHNPFRPAADTNNQTNPNPGSVGVASWMNNTGPAVPASTIPPGTDPYNQTPGPTAINTPGSVGQAGWMNNNNQPGQPGQPGQPNQPGQPIDNSNTFTTPSTSDPNLPGYIGALSEGIPNFFDAYSGLENLPNQVDAWATDAINSQFATGDQIKSVLGNVANQYAGSGIGGGNQYDNAMAEGLTKLGNTINTNKQNIYAQAMNTKANAIGQLPSTAMAPINALSSLSSINANDQYNWANLAANIINSGY